MKELVISHIDKSYGSEIIVHNLSLKLEGGSTLSVLGQSGCGKTTMLKIIAGLVKQDKGSISIDGKSIDQIKPANRNIVYLYQEDLLFPHMNVFENIAFGLKVRKISSIEIENKVNQMINDLQLSGLENKMPHQLSGGQRQRVSFGRAIIINPNVLLLDEPFGSLDSSTRTAMQELFQRLSEQYNMTSIFVTHDVKEAILMGDRIAYMSDGNLKIYASKTDFMQDRHTGVAEEIAFWKSVDKQSINTNKLEYKNQI